MQHGWRWELTVLRSQHPLSKLICLADKLHKKASNQDHNVNSHRA